MESKTKRPSLEKVKLLASETKKHRLKNVEGSGLEDMLKERLTDNIVEWNDVLEELKLLEEAGVITNSSTLYSHLRDVGVRFKKFKELSVDEVAEYELRDERKALKLASSLRGILEGLDGLSIKTLTPLLSILDEFSAEVTPRHVKPIGRPKRRDVDYLLASFIMLWIVHGNNASLRKSLDLAKRFFRTLGHGSHGADDEELLKVLKKAKGLLKVEELAFQVSSMEINRV